MTSNWLKKDILIFTAFILFGAALAYVDSVMNFHTILVEVVHGLVVTAILVFCLISQYRYPEIKKYGWHKILLGVACLAIGSWIDILDDPPSVELLNQMHIPFGRSWEQAFIKKILGYSAGIGLIAYGFFQWVPWMIETRLNVQRLNQRLSNVNQNMKRVLMSLDEHIESERLNISRELHDDVAQQLTFLNYQVQLCQKELEKDTHKASQYLRQIGQEVSEVLRSVRQISQGLRPESLYALGFVPALEQFVEKLRTQTPETTLTLEWEWLPEDQHTRFESRFNDRELLNLFRLLQEGVRNALKHSQASRIDTRIIEEADRYRFLIVDNGIGLLWDTMPSDEALVQDGHLGIVGMKERVKELSGTLELKPNDGPGAQMEIVVSK